ncbi:hypothetical protein GT347_22575 [Xylophilus rhododendri]|uniref:Uncharacterized protein n=1 Tax=Xylophilus rhododendri TaxID=2697032 RepID=A0A857JBC0_9BURK|nr:hypothetical protein [Xylophilus rhododendri]QHJ00514.1 hypothetical protein GT347_22575 [Xylophilus rhododendri]
MKSLRISLRAQRRSLRPTALSVACALALAACGGGNQTVVADATAPAIVQPNVPDVPAIAPTTQVQLSAWPGLTGLTVKVDGVALAAGSTSFTAKTASSLSFELAGVTLATLAPKASITLFDLLPTRDCGSSADLGKLLSLLLALDKDQDPSNGVEIPAIATPAAAGTQLSALSEADLMVLETRLVGRSMPVATALQAANAVLDAETWTEDTAHRTLFTNDMSVLQSYLDRVQAVLASAAGDLSGFAYLSNDEAAKIPATLKGQGMAYDGDTPVFSWRYGLQRADASFTGTLTQPLALPSEIQAEYAANPAGVHLGHIGDIDILDGKLYAPIEDEDDSSQQAYIAVFDARTLLYTGTKYALPRAEHADGVPWVAVDGPRKLAYTVTWSTAAAGKLNVFDLATFTLLRSVPLQSSFDGKRVQGAKVYKGMLYAAADTKDAVTGSDLKRKRIYKVDPVSGSVIELLHYDEPNRTEGEGLAFGPDGRFHLAVLAAYTTPLYAQSTTNARPFDSSYSIDGDDWNPTGTLRHFSRDAAPLREKICAM